MSDLLPASQPGHSERQPGSMWQVIDSPQVSAFV